MKRRFLQFSLRGLLALTAFVGLLLIAPRLIQRYGQFLEAAPSTSGDHSFRVRGRLIRYFEPTEIEWVLHVEESTDEYNIRRYSQRSWFFIYTIDEVLELGGRPFDTVGREYVPCEPGSYGLRLMVVPETYEPEEPESDEPKPDLSTVHIVLPAPRGN